MLSYHTPASKMCKLEGSWDARREESRQRQRRRWRPTPAQPSPRQCHSLCLAWTSLDRPLSDPASAMPAFSTKLLLAALGLALAATALAQTAQTVRPRPAHGLERGYPCSKGASQLPPPLACRRASCRSWPCPASASPMAGAPRATVRRRRAAATPLQLALAACPPAQLPPPPATISRCLPPSAQAPRLPPSAQAPPPPCRLPPPRRLLRLRVPRHPAPPQRLLLLHLCGGGALGQPTDPERSALHRPQVRCLRLSAGPAAAPPPPAAPRGPAPTTSFLPRPSLPAVCLTPGSRARL